MLGWLLSVAYWIPTIVAVVDYFRRRPEWYWLLVIFFFGPLGAIVYLLVVVLPASGASDAVSITFAERRRKRELEVAVARNSTPGHLAELGELYYKDKKFADAARMLERAVAEGIDHEEAGYYLGRSYEALGRFADAVPPLVGVVRRNPRFRFGEAFLALGRCLEADGQKKDAEAAYREVLKNHTYAEARWRLAQLLTGQGKHEEARELAELIIADAAGQPRFARGKEASYVSKARAWLTQHRAM
ncbi:MAG: tetratricopeptide repeat protein [Deltaproteobacteria bacterium]|nr:tetratricopeptide repeat protein [Deltaproteobacteria bacterium]